MTIERLNEIKLEAKKRLNKWLSYSTFEDMTLNFSQIRFEMAIGLFGYPFEKEYWMGKNDFNKFVTEEEFDSIEVSIILNKLFKNQINKTK
jgi:hypothetical protein